MKIFRIFAEKCHKFGHESLDCSKGGEPLINRKGVGVSNLLKPARVVEADVQKCRGALFHHRNSASHIEGVQRLSQITTDEHTVQPV